jgi:patatin-like phospholipase/acyl hydrolase
MYNFGNLTFEDLAVEELMAISYEYNSKNPRFFSKYFLESDPGRYNVYLRQAVGGSSSAPTYFNPLPFVDGYGIDNNLVDGGIISNNPAFFSYIMSKHLLNQTDIRVISMGTGR